jgi:hypothetical protein
MPEREAVTLTRNVTGRNYVGSLAGRTAEIVDVVIEWPNGKPAEYDRQFVTVSSWVIAQRLA